MEEMVQALKVESGRRGETLLAPQEVQKMLVLQALGWGTKRIRVDRAGAGLGFQVAALMGSGAVPLLHRAYRLTAPVAPER